MQSSRACPSPFQTVEGDVGFSGGARQGESDAEDNLDVLRPHKRQKIDEYIPSEQFGGFKIHVLTDQVWL
jgi:hypothetical protein